jgi:hypothetical protein
VATRRNKDGTPVRYLQLTHNEWDPVTKTSRPKVLHSFGREDQLDRDAIKRLVASLTRLLNPATALTSATAAGSEGLAFTSSRPVGGTVVLDALWRRLGIDTVMTRLLEGRKRDPRTERVLFALVANRALVSRPGFSGDLVLPGPGAVVIVGVGPGLGQPGASPVCRAARPGGQAVLGLPPGVLAAQGP